MRRAQRTRYDRYQATAEGLVDHSPAAPNLGPGETLRIETPIEGPSYEANVGVPVLQALAFGTGAALMSIVPTWFFSRFPWYTPLLVWPTVTGIAVYITPAKAHQLLMRVEEWTGVDIDQDGKVGDDPAVDMSASVTEGQTTTTANLSKIPLSQAKAWRLFCQSYIAGECRFSGNAAEDNGVDRALYNKVIQRWARLDPKLRLIEPDSIGDRKTPRLTSKGDDLVLVFATAPLSQLITQLEQLTGTDRQ